MTKIMEKPKSKLETVREVLRKKGYRKGSTLLASDAKILVTNAGVGLEDINKDVQSTLSNLSVKGHIVKKNPGVQDGIYKVLNNSKYW